MSQLFNIFFTTIKKHNTVNYNNNSCFKDVFEIKNCSFENVFNKKNESDVLQIIKKLKDNTSASFIK